MEAGKEAAHVNLALTPAKGVDTAGISFRNYCGIGIQLALVLVLLRQYQIEGTAFVRLSSIRVRGFRYPRAAPAQVQVAILRGAEHYRTAMVLGAVTAHGCSASADADRASVICVSRSGSESGACCWPLAAVLALQRAALLPFPWSEAIWPILGSMFMFRLIVYLYDLRHDTAPRVAGRGRCRTSSCCRTRASRCFPVVDYKTFRRNYFDDDAYRIYQIGHRLDGARRHPSASVPRIVYYHLTLAPSEVTGPGAARRSTWSRTSCCTCASRGSSTSSSACCTCSASACRRPTTSTSSRRASPTSGAGSTSTGRTSCRRSSTTRLSSG